jgi:hypothetical protein
VREQIAADRTGSGQHQHHGEADPAVEGEQIGEDEHEFAGQHEAEEDRSA